MQGEGLNKTGKGSPKWYITRKHLKETEGSNGRILYASLSDDHTVTINRYI